MSNFHPTGQCKFWWSKKLHKSILRTCLQKKKKLWVEEKFWFPKNSYVAKNNHYKQTIHICQQFLNCRKTITSAKYIEVHFNSFLGQNKIILLFGVKKQNGSTMQITMFWEGCKLLVKERVCPKSVLGLETEICDKATNSEFGPNHTWYMSFFLHEQNFWRIKFTPKNANFLH